MGMLDSFLHPEKGFNAASGELDKYYNQGVNQNNQLYNQAQQYYVDAQGYLRPYNEHGEAQYNRLNQQAEALNNPVALENQWADSYKTSPYAQHLMNQATETGNAEASRYGLVGSSAALNNVQQNAGNIFQADRQQYLNDLMQKYMASIGLGQSLYGTGATAAGEQAQLGGQQGALAALQGQNLLKAAMEQGQNQAGLKFGAQNAPGEMLGKILGGATNLGINYFTGALNK